MKLRTVVVLLAIAPYPAAGQTPHRELGPHEHGRGTLNIAVEGDKVTMELETPGMDIVGFEHEAKTKRDKLAVEKAKAQLSAPQSLFALPPAADCRAKDITVAIEFGEHDHGAKDAGTAGDSKDASTKEEGHSEFHAEYTIECASTRAIDAIAFGYFRAFAGAERLDVTLITPKGQSKFEATREKPNISLAGMM